MLTNVLKFLFTKRPALGFLRVVTYKSYTQKTYYRIYGNPGYHGDEFIEEGLDMVETSARVTDAMKLRYGTTHFTIRYESFLLP